MKKQMGISLSEVLISLFLSTLIISALIQFYLNSKREYLVAEEALAADFDLQWVNDLLSDSIRRAGFTPCLGIDGFNLKDKEGGRIQGIQMTPSTIQIYRMHERFVPLTDVKNATQIIVPKSTAFHAKRSLLIADCDHGEIQQIASMQPYANDLLITFNRPLQFHYAKTAYVGELVAERWFIKKNLKGEESLHYQSIQAEEITPLINTLKTHIQYIHGKVFVEVLLGLVDGKTHKLMVAVRGS